MDMGEHNYYDLPPRALRILAELGDSCAAHEMRARSDIAREERAVKRAFARMDARSATLASVSVDADGVPTAHMSDGLACEVYTCGGVLRAKCARSREDQVVGALRDMGALTLAQVRRLAD